MLRPGFPVLAGLSSVAVAALVLAGCTSGSSPSSPPSTTGTTPASTVRPTSATPTAPVSTGPTTAVSATSCPYVTQAFVRPTIGMRLGRVTQLRSGGKVVGCRFYAFQSGPLHASEHLPGPNQPAVEITTQRYPSATAAHNAFVLRAGTAGGITQTDFDGVTGLCFPTEFDPQDKGADWACTVNKGTVMVLVRSVDTAHTVGTSQILRTALRAVTG